MARPTKYNQKLADKICARLAEGQSLRTVCSEKGMPDKASVFRWLREYRGFCDQYIRAKQEAADALAEEMLDIADDGTNDYMEKLSDEGEVVGYAYNNEHVQRSKLRIETRKWLASKMKPKVYGEKKEVETFNHDVTPEDRMAAAAYGLGLSEYLRRRDEDTLPPAPELPEPEGGASLH